MKVATGCDSRDCRCAIFVVAIMLVGECGCKPNSVLVVCVHCLNGITFPFDVLKHQ